MDFTFGVDTTSTVSVEQIKGFLDLENFLFCQSWAFKGFSVELFGFCWSSFFHLNYIIQLSKSQILITIYLKKSIKTLEKLNKKNQSSDSKYSDDIQSFKNQLKQAILCQHQVNSNLYFLLMDIQKSESHQALLKLMKQLSRQQSNIHFINMLVEDILDKDQHKIIKLKIFEKCGNELVRFCKQIKNSKNAEDLNGFKNTLQDILDVSTIEYIIQLKVIINNLTRLFISLSEQAIQKFPIPQLEFSSLLRTLFLKSYLNLDQVQKIQDKINAFKRNMFGWIRNSQTQDYIRQYKRRGQEIISIRQDNKKLRKIKENQDYCLRQTLTELQNLKNQILFYQSQQKQLQRKLKAYQSQQIFEPNQQQDQNTKFNFISQEIKPFIQLTETNDHLEKKIQKYNIERKVIEIDIFPIQKEYKLTQTDMKQLSHIEIQTDIIGENKSIYASYQIQTQDIQIQLKETEVQTISITTIDCQVQGKPHQQILYQYQLIMQKKMRIQSLFQGSIFADNLIYKQRLIRHIQNKGGSLIKETRVVYRYDPLNGVNIHSYIDNIQGLLFIVKTLKGNILAGFYSAKLIPNKILSQFGLLINLNKDQSYILLQNQKGKIHRAMVYDDYYVIFGNAELRVKTGQDFVFSNFGIMNSYFNHQGKKVADFLGEDNNRVAKFEIYEFYQVIFEQ